MGSGKRTDKHSPKRLGEKLRKIRESYGDSQADFLIRLGNPESILQGSISGYERGQREPPLLILLRYSKLANVSTDVLIDDLQEIPNEVLTKEKTLQK